MVPAQVQHSVSLDAALLVLRRQENWSRNLPSSHRDSQSGVGKVPNALLWAGMEMRVTEAKPYAPREATATAGSVHSPLLVGMGK